MNQLKILMHIDSLQFTVEEYSQLQSTLQKSQNYRTDQYLFTEKIQQKPWKACYKAINKQTGRNQFLEVYEVYKLAEDAREKQTQKLRHSVRQQMRMNSEYVISCQDCLQNDNFFIIAKQYCPEQTLKQRLAKCEKFSEFECVQAIKQLIRALSELYRQNIYLEQLNLLKIKSVEGVWKLNQFENCYCEAVEKCAEKKALNHEKEEKINPEKKFVEGINRNEKTRKELVMGAMYQLGKVFCQMAFGMIEIDDEELSAIGKDMVNFRTVYGISLSEYARQFLKLTLSIKPKQKSKFTWKQLIQLKVFIDETRRISNTQFLKLSLLSPQHPQSSEFLPQPPSSQQSQLLYQQQQQLYLQYKKTQLLLHSILKRIQTQHQCFSLENKQLLQILYLICVRCRNNCARMQWLFKKVKHTSSCIEKYINQQKIQEERIQANKLFDKYSGELTNKENEKVEIVKDWISVAVSISQLKFFEKAKRNKFLGDGFEHTQQNNHHYSKEQQINFTSDCIKAYLKSIKNFSDNRYHVYFYLMHYKDILDIKFEDLTEVTFQQKVRTILSQ